MKIFSLLGPMCLALMLAGCNPTFDKGPKGDHVDNQVSLNNTWQSGANYVIGNEVEMLGVTYQCMDAIKCGQISPESVEAIGVWAKVDVSAGNDDDTPPNHAPTVNISSHENNDNLLVGQTQNIVVMVSDQDLNLKKVTLILDGRNIDTKNITNNGNVNFRWTPSTAKTYLVEIKAEDQLNAVVSIYINLVANNPNVAPNISNIMPGNNASFNVGESISIGALIQDTDNGDDNISTTIYVAGNNILNQQVVSGTTVSAQYVVAEGPQVIEISATDNENEITTVTRTITGTQDQETNQAPVIDMSADQSNLVVTQGDQVVISGNVTDVDHNFKDVKLYADALLIDTKTTANFSFNWVATLNTTKLTIVASDELNASNNREINVTVNELVAESVAPTVEFVSLENNSTVETGSIDIEVFAQDLDVDLKQLELFVDGQSVAIVNFEASINKSHTFTIEINQPGSKLVKVLATDSMEMIGTSEITLNVADPMSETFAPTIAISSPNDGTSFDLGTQTIRYTASDADSDLVAVTLFINNVEVDDYGFADAAQFNQDFSYDFTNTGVTNIKIVARDSEGLTNESSVNVTVTQPVLTDAQKLNQYWAQSCETCHVKNANNTYTTDYFASSRYCQTEGVNCNDLQELTQIIADRMPAGAGADSNDCVGDCASLTAGFILNKMSDLNVSFPQYEAPQNDPVISITLPSRNSNHEIGNVQISYNASDVDGDLVKVALYIDNNFVEEINFSSVNSKSDTFTYNFSQAGSAQIKLIATDSGNRSSEEEISVTIKDNAVTPSVDPWVSGTVYEIGDKVSYDGKVWECVVSPYFCKTLEPTNPHASDSWVETDDAVEPPQPTAPVITFNSPRNNADVELGVTTIRYSATDADNDLTKLELFVEGQSVKLSQFAAASNNTITFDQNFSAQGNKTLKVVATDNENLSSELSITINVTGEVVVPPGGDYDSGLPQGTWPHALRENNKAYNNDTNSVVGTYFVEWGVYEGRNYHASDVPAENLTHIIYGFIPICGPNPYYLSVNPGGHETLQRECGLQNNDPEMDDYGVVILDRNASVQAVYEEDSDVWNSRTEEGPGIYPPYAGNFGQLMRMKDQNPDLVILPSIGGWTLSDPFFDFADDTIRAKFVASSVAFIKKYDFFGGIDIDWEFPGGGGGGDLGHSTDGATYIKLMRELRAALDELSQETGRYYEVTSAIGGATTHISHVDYGQAAEFMDYIFIMNYDYMGSWSPVLGHQTNLYASQMADSVHDVSKGVQALLAQGVDPQQLVMGVANYGRGWKEVTGMTAENPFAGQGGGALKDPGYQEAGIMDYKYIEENYLGGVDGNGINGWTKVWDAQAMAPFLYNLTDRKFISYDDVDSVLAKGQYVRQYNLGGVFSWEIDGDNGHLTNAMHEGLGHSEK